MKPNLLMAVMHVMGRLGLWAPYLHFVQAVLDILDRACEEAWGYVWWGNELYDLEENLDG